MGKFGWSLPPGVSHRMIDEAYGVEEPCMCCGEWENDCICEECPQCSEYGNPICYVKHGMKYTDEQLAGQKELKDRIEDERMKEDALYREYLLENKLDGEQEERKLQARYDDKEIFISNTDDGPSIFDEE